MYVLELIKNIQRDASALERLVSAFKQEHSDVADNMTAVNLDIAASSIVANRVVNRVLQLRNKYAGALLAAIRSINALDIKSEDDFGKGLHSAHTEPYFYESAYKYKDSIPKVVAQDELGACRHVDDPSAGKDKECTPKTWKCSDSANLRSVQHIGF